MHTRVPPRRPHPRRQKVPEQACHRRARRRPMKSQHNTKRGRNNVLTANSSARTPHTRGETRKAHDLSAELALHPRQDPREGDLPRGGINGVEAPKSATAKVWRVNITIPRHHLRVCTGTSFGKNSPAVSCKRWQRHEDLPSYEQRDTRYAMGSIPPRIQNTTWSSSDPARASASEGHGHTCTWPAHICQSDAVPPQLCSVSPPSVPRCTEV